MVLLSEWLPNPDGADTGAEWIELANKGAAPADLAGWRLAAGKKSAALRGVLPPGGYLVFPAQPLGLALVNTDGSLRLSDPAGRLADEAKFLGAAPSGKSFARTGSGFRFLAPTPGAPNPEAAIVEASYPVGVPLHPAPSGLEAVVAALLTGLLAALAATYITHRLHDLHDLLFPRYEAPGRAGGPDAR